LVYFRPYVKDRIMLYLKPSEDLLGRGYQLNQSLIAIGSGGVFGKGFGQGTQKFGYLPEPVGDSIFAVLGEEFGFAGVSFMLFILLFFILRVFVLAKRSQKQIIKISIISFASVLLFQSFMNMGAMTGAIPLTGLTFPMLSLGGTSILVSGFMFGLIFSASAHSAKNS